MAVTYRADPATHVAVITIDRPEVRNAVNPQVARELEAAIDELEADSAVRVGLLAAAGPVFCAGADLKAVAAGEIDQLETERGSFAGIVTRKRTKPLIAVVEGAALAGGFEIVLACDLVVAGESAWFGLPEVSRSLVAAGGGLARLGQRLPLNVVMEWALTGRSYPASRAAELGLVNEVVPDGDALAAAHELARAIIANAPAAVVLSRAALLEMSDPALRDGLAASRAALQAVVASEDFAEGARAFVEKRSPVWAAARAVDRREVGTR